MEIIITGTIGGWKVFYSKSTAPSSIRDVRPQKRSEGPIPIGQTAYSIAIDTEGCVFTKYIIIKDQVRNEAGNIAFSIFTKHNEKLSGQNINKLLDELAIKHKIEDIIKFNKYQDVLDKENIIQESINRYERELKTVSMPNINPQLLGTAEAAFIYYSDVHLLEKYFDLPYQKEYYKYKLVFFVDDKLKDKHENPLNALRFDPSSDLTEAINLENPEYMILILRDDIKVLVNGRACPNRSKIKCNDDLELIYEVRYYDKKIFTGKLFELNQNLVEVNHLQNYVKILFDANQLSPSKHDILIDVVDENMNPVIGAKITCKLLDNSFNVHKKESYFISENGNNITFEGDEIGKRYEISVSKNDSKNSTVIIPEKSTHLKIQLNLRSSGSRTYETRDLEEHRKSNKYKSRPDYYKLALILWAIVIILIGITVYHFLHFTDQDENKNILKMDLEYIEGNELKIDKLNTLKKEYCQNTDEQPTTNESEFCRKIKRAIKIRKFIEQGSIYDLKKQEYSEQQSNFLIILNRIDNQFIQKISKTIKENPSIQNMTLITLGDFIIQYQKLLEIELDVPNLPYEELLRTDQEIRQLDFPNNVEEIKDEVESIRTMIKNKRNELQNHQEDNENLGVKKSRPSKEESKEIDQSKNMVYNEDELNKAFLKLIKEEVYKMDNYVDLLNKYKNSKIVNQPFYFLRKICKDWIRFQDFITISGKIAKIEKSNIITFDEFERCYNKYNKLP
jgi:hypothetical protein